MIIEPSSSYGVHARLVSDEEDQDSEEELDDQRQIEAQQILNQI